MINRADWFPIICLIFLGLALEGCSQISTPEAKPTVELTLAAEPVGTFVATVGADTSPLPTPLSLPTATPTPKGTSTPTPGVESEENGSQKSGIMGQVFRGPICPGPVIVDDPCPDQPFSAQFHVFDSQEKHVASFLTDEQGRFSVLLTPGMYTIVPDESTPIMHPTSQGREVSVQDEQFSEVTLIFDTGIR
jgi:hypothetical protein